MASRPLRTSVPNLLTGPLYAASRMASQAGPSSLGISKKYVVVGIAILVIAVAAGFLTQPEPGQDFDVTWTTSSRDLGARQVPIGDDGGTETVAWTIDHRNVTRAHVNLTVASTSNHTGQDELTLDVDDPAGNASSSTGTFSGAGPATLPLRHDLADVPEATTVHALNATDAEAKVAAEHADEAGQGTWTIRVTVDHSGPVADHDVEVAVEIRTYRAVIAPAGNGG